MIRYPACLALVTALAWALRRADALPWGIGPAPRPEWVPALALAAGLLGLALLAYLAGPGRRSR